MDNINLTTNYDERMDSRIVSNPIYKDQLHKVFKTLREPVKWTVFDDGSFEIIGSTIEEEDKKVVSSVRFRIEDGFLNITTTKSSFTKLKSFIAGNIGDSDKFDKFKELKAKTAPFINTVECSCGMFTEEGIELAHMDSLDDYVITDESTVKDEEGMINITRSHYPQPFEVPQDMFYSFPFAQGATYSERNIKYRSLFDLTIINVDSFQTGKPFSREQYPASSKNPELVEPNGIPFSNKEYYRRSYLTDNVDELNKKIGLAFFKGMELSRIKIANPKVYESVKEKVSKRLEIPYVKAGDDPAIICQSRAI